MIKYGILLFNLVGLMFLRLFTTAEVPVTAKAPSQVDAGGEFTMEVTIEKSSISGFAQLKLEFPEGFSGFTAVNKDGADFKISGTTLRFTWTSLPSQETLKITLKALAPQGNDGKKSITGKFSYVLDNNKQFTEMSPVEIMVGKESTPPPPPPDNTTTTTNPPPPDNTSPTGNEKTAPPAVVSIERKMPSEINAGDEFTVEVLIKKDALKGFARFQDLLPEGFTATALESKGGTFSFVDQKAKIVWDNVPTEESFTVSYKVKTEKNISGSLPIEGLFSYVENDEPKKYIFPSVSINVKKTETTPPPPDNTVPTNPPPPDNTVTTNPPPPDNTVTTNPPPPDTPPTNSNVIYRVQICASHSTPVDNTYFQNKYGIGDNVRLEPHEGWNKYTVGSFPVYKEARDQRQKVRGMGVTDAFVTAYNKGTRITVQEALMLTKQQWYQ